MIRTILFDLDGTLLPMDNDVFTKGYFKGLAAKLAPLGYEPKKLIAAVWSGTAAMVKNDGSRGLTPDELLRMDWLCENIVGKIPDFDEIEDYAKPMVRQLGIHRDRIPMDREGSL